MGNLCGKASRDDPFDAPGRTLGSTPAPASGTVSVPSAARRSGTSKTAAGSPGRQLGGKPTAQGEDGAREAAARAAEVCQLSPSCLSGDRPFVTSIWMG
jgi:hypothetical protein